MGLLRPVTIYIRSCPAGTLIFGQETIGGTSAELPTRVRRKSKRVVW